MKKKTALLAAATTALLALTGCQAADVASRNLSKSADNFEVNRRIVFFNGITDKYLLEIEGMCSVTADGTDKQLEVTCKIGEEEYKKHFLGLSDNVTYFVEHLESTETDSFHYTVRFRPEVIIPDVQVDTSN